MLIEGDMKLRCEIDYIPGLWIGNNLTRQGAYEGHLRNMRYQVHKPLKLTKFEATNLMRSLWR